MVTVYKILGNIWEYNFLATGITRFPTRARKCIKILKVDTNEEYVLCIGPKTFKWTCEVKKLPKDSYEVDLMLYKIDKDLPEKLRHYECVGTEPYYSKKEFINWVDTFNRQAKNIKLVWK